MSVCEDYGYIARRLREIKDEALHGAGASRAASHEQPAEKARATTDFNGWFWQLVGSTG